MESQEDLVKIGRALANPLRVRMLLMLTLESTFIQDIAQRLHIPYALAHMHLKILEEAGLIEGSYVVEEKPRPHLRKIYTVRDFRLLIDRKPTAGAVSTATLPYGSIAAMAVSGLVIGAGVPVALFYMAFKIGTWPFLVAATILGAVAIFWGAIMAIVAFVPVIDNVEEQVDELRRQPNMHRAIMRGLLEELDEINSTLKDVGDELKKVFASQRVKNPSMGLHASNEYKAG